MAMNEADLARPYAAPANVISVLQRVRTRNLPDRVDDDLLRLAGVPDGAMHRVHSALRFLGLVEEDGRPSDDLHALASAPEDRYRELLEGIVRTAYGADFGRVDPTQDTQAQIVTAFQPYQPRSQISRMVILFLGLCREAGISVAEAPRERQMATTRRPATKPASKKSGKKKIDEGEGGSGSPSAAAGQGLPFGITETDIALMDEAEFEDVWKALGTALSKVSRARARAREAAAASSAKSERSAAADQGGEDEEG